MCERAFEHRVDGAVVASSVRTEQPLDEVGGSSMVPCTNLAEHLERLLYPETASLLDSEEFGAVLSAISGAASFAIKEHDYFDVDYRSEFALTHETHFETRDVSSSRLHFFSTWPGHSLQKSGLYRTVQQLADSYLGYVVIRPQTPGSVGRSVLTWLPMTPVTVDGLPEASRLRTAVSDWVHLFGVPLVAVGVPYMKQDGHLLRCAHVVAWSAHYSAAMRGFQLRRPTGHFHTAALTLFPSTREYPSPGLTATSVASMLSRLDLAPDRLVSPERKTRTAPDWYDRSLLWRIAETPDLNALDTLPIDYDEADEDDDEYVSNRLWRRERFAAGVCRYLNSGFPTIICDYFDDHAYIITGYLRRAQISEQSLAGLPADDLNLVAAAEAAAIDTDSEVLGFVCSDDTGKPYDVRWLSEIFEREITGKVSALIPLPPGLWLPGSRAELIGAERILEAVRDLATGMASVEGYESDSHKTYRERQLRKILNAFAAKQAGPYAVRTYATTGTDFKKSYAERLGGDRLEALERVAYQNLPKFVWVVELVSRTLREPGQLTQEPEGDVGLRQGGVTVGEIVLDASASTEDAARAFLVNLPGAVMGVDATSWRPTGFSAYQSGRWEITDRGIVDAKDAFMRQKSVYSSAIF